MRRTVSFHAYVSQTFVSYLLITNILVWPYAYSEFDKEQQLLLKYTLDAVRF